MHARHYPKPISAAIDFGTAYSGYAFSWKNDVTRIHCNQSWIAGNRGLVSLKTPTCILLNSDKTFNSFGFEAENNFAALAEAGNHTGMLFFLRFKMALHENRTLSRKTLLKDIRGEAMPAITIFTMAIRYMKDHLLDSLRLRSPQIIQDDIQFVVTVPAIWDERAKTFMRTAAIEAGIGRDQLSLALESEAASIWCQHVPLGVDRESASQDIINLPINSKYMVVDLGGGTADITVHVLKSDRTLREIHRASGGPWGGVEVDKSFVKLIHSIFGDRTFKEFINSHVSDFLDLLREFEIKKRNIKLCTEGKITIKLPLSLKQIFEKDGSSLVKELDSSYLRGRVTSVDDKLRMDADLLKDCFENVIQKTIMHIKVLLKEPSMQDLSTILLAGGFSNCAIVQEHFKREFQSKRNISVLVPGDGEMLVLRGAVIHGHDPDKVSSRIARYTYGLAITTDFDPKVHPAEKRKEVDERSICVDVFWKAVEIGEEIPVGHKVTRIGKPVDPNQKAIQHDIYRANRACPQFVTDPGCEKIGSIRCPLPEGVCVEDKEIDEVLFFGMTELKYVVRHRKTGEEFVYDIDTI